MSLSSLLRLRPHARPTGPVPGVTSRPGVMGGTPCIAGTRIPAQTIADLCSGPSAAAVAQAQHYYPLTRGQVLVACWWAATNTVGVHPWDVWAEAAYAGLARGDYAAVPDPYEGLAPAIQPEELRRRRRRGPTTHLPSPDPDGDGVITADGLHLDTFHDALTALMGLCGCGSIEGIQADAVAALRTAASPLGTRTPPSDDTAAKYEELLLGLLDHLGLVDHGGTITYGWTTPLGDQWLAALTAEGETS